MNHTMIKRFNIVLSFWLIAIIGMLLIYGFQESNIGFLVVSVILGILLVIMNIVIIVSSVLDKKPNTNKQKSKYLQNQ